MRNTNQINFYIMKLSFNFSKQQIKEVVVFAVIVATVLILMQLTGADFR